ncbi:MAG: NUDIX domain-containing protein [Bacteroidales bacterium]|nr:NUDIX domain-containing protein [Bacteroidales bacterium]
MTGEELLPVINEDGEFIKLAPRSRCHDGHSMLLHPVIHLHLVDKEKRILLQKRSMNKDIQPGKWDTSVGGHVDPGEDIEQALLREAREEAGLVDFEYTLIDKYIWESDLEREMVHSYYAVTDHTPVPDPDEIDEARYWSRNEIEENLGKGVFTPNFEHEYRHFLKNLTY